MTLQVARLALPFTDADLATGNVRLTNTATATSFTVTIPLPSVSGISRGYYNGGDLDGGDTTTFTLPDESLAMAFAMAVAAHGDGFDLDVTEDPLLPGRYVFTRQDANQWDILWGDALTTFPPEWLGFLGVTYSSTSQVITAPWQSDRLWRATRPTWNRVREHKKTALAMTWGGGSSSRQISGIRNEYELKYSAQVGARIYKHDGTIQTLVDVVSGMALNDQNVALESLWAWIAARTPVEYWADEDDLTTSVYLRPRVAGSLESVVRVVASERSNAPPVYDIVLPFVASTAGAAGVGGGGGCSIVISTTYATLQSYDTYEDLPTDANTLGAPADGTQANVTTTGAAGVYTYVATMDAVNRWTSAIVEYTFDQWLPSCWVAQDLVYVVNASGYPARASMGVGGDNYAALTAASRGWIDRSISTGTVGDSGSALVFNAYGVGNFGELEFPLTSSVGYGGDELFMTSDISPTAGDTNAAAMLSIHDSVSNKRSTITWARGGNPGDVGWAYSSTAVQGNGEASGTSAFDRVFATTMQGTASADSSDLCLAWMANIGPVKASSSNTTTSAGNGADGNDKIRLLASSGSNPAAANCLVRECHVLTRR